MPLGLSSSVRYFSLRIYAWFSWINVPSYCIIQNTIELQISMFVFIRCLVVFLRSCCNWKVKKFMCGLKNEILWTKNCTTTKRLVSIICAIYFNVIILVVRQLMHRAFNWCITTIWCVVMCQQVLYALNKFWGNLFWIQLIKNIDKSANTALVTKKIYESLYIDTIYLDVLSIDHYK